MPRLFISIDVPANLYEHCKKLQEAFLGLKKTNEFHMTLQFLGENVPEDKIQMLKSALSSLSFSPFRIETGPAVPFPEQGEPQGIWIVCKNSPALLKLAEDLQKITLALGFIPDYPFRPHITLGRYKNPPQKITKEVQAPSQSFEVKEFHLKKSTSGPEGAKHEILITFPAR